MGAYKYMEELWRKKQSDVMRFLLRVRYVIGADNTCTRHVGKDAIVYIYSEVCLRSYT